MGLLDKYNANDVKKYQSELTKLVLDHSPAVHKETGGDGTMVYVFPLFSPKRGFNPGHQAGTQKRYMGAEIPMNSLENLSELIMMMKEDIEYVRCPGITTEAAASIHGAQQVWNEFKQSGYNRSELIKGILNAAMQREYGEIYIEFKGSNPEITYFVADKKENKIHLVSSKIEAEDMKFEDLFAAKILTYYGLKYELPPQQLLKLKQK